MKRTSVIKRLFSYVGRYKLRLLILLLIGLTSVLFEVAKPLPVKIVIDNVLSGQPIHPAIDQSLSGLIDPGNKTQLLFLCVVSIALIAVASALFSILVMSLTTKLAQRLVYDFSIDFYSKLQKMSLSFYLKNKVGDLIQRMSGDVFVVYFLVAQVVIPAITSLVCLGIMFYIMIQIDFTLALIALAVIPLLGISLTIFLKPINNTTTAQHRKMGQFSSFLQQSLSSMKIIQAFARESFIKSKVQTHASEYGKAFETATRTSHSFNQINLLISGVASAVLIGLGAYRGLQGNFSAGDLYIFIGYIAGLFGPVTALFTAIGTTVAIRARGKRVFDILDSDDVVTERKNAKPLINPEGRVSFENVWFGYDEKKEPEAAILKNISFESLPGQVIAIVGPTGAGKTSLISLLARFYEPWEGTIKIDGQKIDDLQLHSLRENISLVLQEPFLFPMSIYENIAFGNPLASNDDVMKAAKLAQAHDFIMKLPAGYETIISEAGSSLSGGEKQRIALARAFLKKSSILILDEPTSALDALTEARIFKKLPEIAKDKTIFLISHRLSTIKHADQIITLQNGYVVETGTHDNLMQQGNLYADLYKYQHIT